MTKDGLKQGSIDVAHSIMRKISLHGFWALVILAIGFWGGMKYVNHLNDGVTANTIVLGGFVYDGKAYDVTQREIPAVVPTPPVK